jgi:hypothetical protein
MAVAGLIGIFFAAVFVLVLVLQWVAMKPPTSASATDAYFAVGVPGGTVLPAVVTVVASLL